MPKNQLLRNRGAPRIVPTVFHSLSQLVWCFYSWFGYQPHARRRRQHRIVLRHPANHRRAGCAARDDARSVHKNDVAGPCPYCGVPTKTSDATLRLECPACHRVVGVRDMKLYKVEG